MLFRDWAQCQSAHVEVKLLASSPAAVRSCIQQLYGRLFKWNLPAAGSVGGRAFIAFVALLAWSALQDPSSLSVLQNQLVGKFLGGSLSNQSSLRFPGFCRGGRPRPPSRLGPSRVDAPPAMSSHFHACRPLFKVWCPSSHPPLSRVGPSLVASCVCRSVVVLTGRVNPVLQMEAPVSAFPFPFVRVPWCLLFSRPAFWQCPAPRVDIRLPDSALV